ncbi:MAG: alpha/beta fold hydrolase [Candidatus Sumerlaeaceae bacterium]|nr:alpha/beta fold hydrolase [Candidatus Sumerlaeaceae bacterium]
MQLIIKLCTACLILMVSIGHSKSLEVEFATSHALVRGTLLLPETSVTVPCVVIIGGTLSSGRDGQTGDAGAPRRDALSRLALELSRAGYASLRFDKVGYGPSRPLPGWNGTYLQESQVAAAAMEFARHRPEISRVAAAGESAGAFLACLAAKSGSTADAYVFLGGHCGPGEEIYEYNFGNLLQYATQSPENMEWARKTARQGLALGRGYKEMFAAVREGLPDFVLHDGDFITTFGLARRREEVQWPPDEMYRHIKSPTLALAGEFDLNVRPEHAARIARIINDAGFTSATSIVIPGVDHSFQLSAPDPDTRMRERHSRESYKRPYPPTMYRELITWLDRTIPTPLQAARDAALASDSTLIRPSDIYTTQTNPASTPRIDETTTCTPRRVQLAPGITILDDITDTTNTPGVMTLEGRIGPLLLGDSSQAHFIEMSPGMFLGEHPHSSESIIYTVRGNWVLCSNGQRHVMRPGSLYWFARNTPTGYEMPFDEPAYILIFKGERSTAREKDFMDYLRGLNGWLEGKRNLGEAFTLGDLPTTHPARLFSDKLRSSVKQVR